MTSLGTFGEGVILVILAIAAAVLSQLLKIDWLLTAVAPALLVIALSYISGGAAGKAQMLSKLIRNGLVSEKLTTHSLRRWVK